MPPEIGYLLLDVHRQATRQPIEPGELKRALAQLLKFLISDDGATDGLVRGASQYLAGMKGVTLEAREPLFRLLLDMSSAMGESRSSADIARDAESTPAQLLRRLQQLGE
jgi:hypothetical protein